MIKVYLKREICRDVNVYIYIYIYVCIYIYICMNDTSLQYVSFMYVYIIYLQRFPCSVH